MIILLNDYEKNLQTVLLKIREMIFTYCTDMMEYKNETPKTIFNVLSKRLEYIPDPRTIELIMRPKILFLRGGGDCDDKTIAACSYFVLNQTPCGFSIVADDERKEYHHIFAFFFRDGKKVDFDCTYSHNRFPSTRTWEKRVDYVIYNGAN